MTPMIMCNCLVDCWGGGVSWRFNYLAAASSTGHLAATCRCADSGSHSEHLGGLNTCNFRGLSWKRYDECFRPNPLEFAISMLDKNAHCGGNSFRNMQRTGGRPLPKQRSYQTSQCFRFEQSGAYTKPACPHKHACATTLHTTVDPLYLHRYPTVRPQPWRSTTTRPTSQHP